MGVSLRCAVLCVCVLGIQAAPRRASAFFQAAARGATDFENQRAGGSTLPPAHTWDATTARIMAVLQRGVGPGPDDRVEQVPLAPATAFAARPATGNPWHWGVNPDAPGDRAFAGDSPVGPPPPGLVSALDDATSMHTGVVLDAAAAVVAGASCTWNTTLWVNVSSARGASGGTRAYAARVPPPVSLDAATATVLAGFWVGRRFGDLRDTAGMNAHMVRARVWRRAFAAVDPERDAPWPWAHQPEEDTWALVRSAVATAVAAAAGRRRATLASPVQACAQRFTQPESCPQGVHAPPPAVVITWEPWSLHADTDTLGVRVTEWVNLPPTPGLWKPLQPLSAATQDRMDTWPTYALLDTLGTAWHTRYGWPLSVPRPWDGTAREKIHVHEDCTYWAGSGPRPPAGTVEVRTVPDPPVGSGQPAWYRCIVPISEVATAGAAAAAAATETGPLPGTGVGACTWDDNRWHRPGNPSERVEFAGGDYQCGEREPGHTEVPGPYSPEFYSAWGATVAGLGTSTAHTLPSGAAAGPDHVLHAVTVMPHWFLTPKAMARLVDTLGPEVAPRTTPAPAGSPVGTPAFASDWELDWGLWAATPAVDIAFVRAGTAAVAGLRRGLASPHAAGVLTLCANTPGWLACGADAANPALGLLQVVCPGSSTPTNDSLPGAACTYGLPPQLQDGWRTGLCESSMPGASVGPTANCTRVNTAAAGWNGGAVPNPLAVVADAAFAAASAVNGSFLRGPGSARAPGPNWNLAPRPWTHPVTGALWCGAGLGPPGCVTACGNVSAWMGRVVVTTGQGATGTTWASVAEAAATCTGLDPQGNRRVDCYAPPVAGAMDGTPVDRRSGCSGHGTCWTPETPDACVCDPGWAPPFCATCLPGAWGPDCASTCVAVPRAGAAPSQSVSDAADVLPAPRRVWDPARSSGLFNLTATCCDTPQGRVAQTMGLVLPGVLTGPGCAAALTAACGLGGLDTVGAWTNATTACVLPGNGSLPLVAVCTPGVAALAAAPLSTPEFLAAAAEVLECGSGASEVAVPPGGSCGAVLQAVALAVGVALDAGLGPGGWLSASRSQLVVAGVAAGFPALDTHVPWTLGVLEPGVRVSPGPACARWSTNISAPLPGLVLGAASPEAAVAGGCTTAVPVHLAGLAPWLIEGVGVPTAVAAAGLAAAVPSSDAATCAAWVCDPSRFRQEVASLVNASGRVLPPVVADTLNPVRWGVCTPRQVARWVNTWRTPGGVAVCAHQEWWGRETTAAIAAAEQPLPGLQNVTRELELARAAAVDEVRAFDFMIATPRQILTLRPDGVQTLRAAMREFVVDTNPVTWVGQGVRAARLATAGFVAAGVMRAVVAELAVAAAQLPVTRPRSPPQNWTYAGDLPPAGNSSARLAFAATLAIDTCVWAGVAASRVRSAAAWANAKTGVLFRSDPWAGVRGRTRAQWAPTPCAHWVHWARPGPIAANISNWPGGGATHTLAPGVADLPGFTDLVVQWDALVPAGNTSQEDTEEAPADTTSVGAGLSWLQATDAEGSALAAAAIAGNATAAATLWRILEPVVEALVAVPLSGADTPSLALPFVPGPEDPRVPPTWRQDTVAAAAYLRPLVHQFFGDTERAEVDAAVAKWMGAVTPAGTLLPPGGVTVCDLTSDGLPACVEWNSVTAPAHPGAVLGLTPGTQAGCPWAVTGRPSPRSATWGADWTAPAVGRGTGAVGVEFASVPGPADRLLLAGTLGGLLPGTARTSVCDPDLLAGVNLLGLPLLNTEALVGGRTPTFNSLWRFLGATVGAPETWAAVSASAADDTQLPSGVVAAWTIAWTQHWDLPDGLTVVQAAAAALVALGNTTMATTAGWGVAEAVAATDLGPEAPPRGSGSASRRASTSASVAEVLSRVPAVVALLGGGAATQPAQDVAATGSIWYWTWEQGSVPAAGRVCGGPSRAATCESGPGCGTDFGTWLACRADATADDAWCGCSVRTGCVCRPGSNLDPATGCVACARGYLLGPPDGAGRPLCEVDTGCPAPGGAVCGGSARGSCLVVATTPAGARFTVPYTTTEDAAAFGDGYGAVTTSVVCACTQGWTGDACTQAVPASVASGRVYANISGLADVAASAMAHPPLPAWAGTSQNAVHGGEPPCVGGAAPALFVPLGRLLGYVAACEDVARVNPGGGDTCWAALRAAAAGRAPLTVLNPDGVPTAPAQGDVEACTEVGGTLASVAQWAAAGPGRRGWQLYARLWWDALEAFPATRSDGAPGPGTSLWPPVHGLRNASVCVRLLDGSGAAATFLAPLAGVLIPATPPGTWQPPVNHLSEAVTAPGAAQCEFYGPPVCAHTRCDQGAQRGDPTVFV
jgi:hypothetical protein